MVGGEVGGGGVNHHHHLNHTRVLSTVNQNEVYMTDKKFDPKKLKKLNNPQRLKDVPVEYILNKLGLKHLDVFVEIGAGTAFFSIAFLQQAKPSTLYACDISETMLGWIKENVVPDYPLIHPIQNQEASVPLDDKIADLVFMINLHHELDNPGQILDEAFRILKPGGKILVVDWKKIDMAEGPPTHIRCTPEDVKHQMRDSEFKNIQVSNDLEKHFFVTAEK